MLRVYFVGILVLAYVCGEAATAYLKVWDDPEGPETGGPYDQAMLKRLQTYLDAAAEDRQRAFADVAELPAKRQMRYNQCYFNPISCFRRRK